MKFSTSKTELQQALQKLSKATPTRSTLPILGCVLLEASTEKTTLRATDLEITIEVEISVSLERAGSAALPIRTLLDITTELPETRLTLTVDEKNRAEIQTDSRMFQNHRFSTFKPEIPVFHLDTFCHHKQPNLASS